MIIDHYSSLLHNFRGLLLTTIEPIEKIARLPNDTYQYFQQDFKTIEELKKNNSDLKTENFLLKAKQQQLNKLEIEVSRLDTLLGRASQLNKSNIQIANISSYNISPYSYYLTINKGYLDGIEENQAVIDAYGLLGITTLTTPYTAKVQMITDAEVQVPVRIQRTGQRGILKGLYENTLYLQFISNSSSVKIGDLIETSGLANVYPKGYPVAIITKVELLKDQAYLRIIAEPIAQITQAEKVLVLSKPTKGSNKNE